MSRIGVELARSVEEQSALRAGHNSANATNKKYGGYKEYVPEAGGEGQKKRKREAVAEDRDKATLQEFLEDAAAVKVENVGESRCNDCADS